MTTAPLQWTSRIVGHAKADPKTLLANPLNWRVHPKNQREALRGGIADLGFIRSVSVNVNSGTVIDGHLRVALALEEKQEEIDVEWVDLEPEEERLALASFDSIAGLAKTNTETLDKLLRSVSYTSEATQRFLADFAKKNGLYLNTERPKAEDPGSQLDKADQLRIKWGTAAGQTWVIPSMRQLGVAHRLAIRDCTDADAVAHLMGVRGPTGLSLIFNQADLVLTDPPYGVDYTGKTKDALTIANDDRGSLGTRWLIRDAAKAWPIKPGGAWYVCAPAGELELAFRLGLSDAGQNIRQCLVWVKQHFTMGRQDYQWRHESILYGWSEGAAHYFVPDRTQDTLFMDERPDPATLSKKELVDLVKELRRRETTTVWEEDRPSASLLHPTTKPTRLFAKALLNSSKPGEVVFDGFCGSGTTLIACEQNDRVARVMDSEAKYAAATLERCELMGLNPVLEADGD